MGTLDELGRLAAEHEMLGKGFLGLALVITQKAIEDGLPLDPDQMMTSGGGQVRGAGGGRVLAILAQHGITRRLSAEGGRTSRGTPAKMRALVAFLNERRSKADFDLDAIMAFWIERVRAYFAGKPFTLELDPAHGVSGLIRTLMAKVEARQQESAGSTLVGTVIQHLIGAKIEVRLGIQPGELARHGASVNDAKGRGGDLELGDTIIHITTAPGQAVIEKCAANIRGGYRPMLITGRNRLQTAEGLIADQGLAGRIDLLDYEQFLLTNIFEMGGFDAGGRRGAIERILDRYNDTVIRLEGDPSLRIEVQASR